MKSQVDNSQHSVKFSTFIGDRGFTVIEKEIGGVKRKLLRGIATSTTIDYESERVAPEFLDKIFSTMKGLNVFWEHQHSIDKLVGTIYDFRRSENAIEVDTLLESEDSNEYVKKILDKLEAGYKLGYSVGGVIYKSVKVWVDEIKRYVRDLVDGAIVELSVTALPANPDSMVSLITKSFHKNAGDNMDIEVDSVEKVLDQKVEIEELSDSIWRYYRAFVNGIWQIVYDDEMDAETKQSNIVSLSDEFGAKMREITERIAQLNADIEAEQA